MIAIETQINKDIQFSKNMGIVFPNAFEANFLPDTETIVDGMITLLEQVMNDAEEHWIQHFILELNFGAKSKSLPIHFNNKLIQMCNVRDLYEFLTNK
jgi:hypothetical protein